MHGKENERKWMNKMYKRYIAGWQRNNFISNSVINESEIVKMTFKERSITTKKKMQKD